MLLASGPEVLLPVTSQSPGLKEVAACDAWEGVESWEPFSDFIAFFLGALLG